MRKHPSWIRVRVPTPAEAENITHMRNLLGRFGLTTVCQGAVCPNAAECWSARTATFMILGDVCTRACRFCGVPTGHPGGVTDEEEPRRLAAAVAELGLRYVVLTSVDRDDLPDGGSSLFAEAVARIRVASPGIRVEVLIPDFSCDLRSLDRILVSGADVIGHNLETVARLSPQLRDARASYEQSLAVLSHLSDGAAAQQRIKSGLMLGLAETDEEIATALRDLRQAGVGSLTLGQYLRPTAQAAPVARYLSPEDFEEWARKARVMGFRSVVAGPLVRSSYHAAEAFDADATAE